MDRLACAAFPQNYSLALIGDADRRDVLCTHSGLCQRGLCRRQLRLPNFLRIMLHPAWLRIILLEFLLRHTANAALVIKDDAATACGALIQRKNVPHNGRPPLTCE